VCDDLWVSRGLISLSTMFYCVPSRFPRAFLDVVGYWADLCRGVGGREVWERVFPVRKDGGGKKGLVKKAMVAVGTAEVFLESCREFASECVRAETVVAGRKTDMAVLDAVDFVLVECEGEAHVQPALDAAVGYQEGVMMRAVLRWLASV
ncbi:hypothetical protein FQN53_004942, partial [Emmonsiellopsis sp. PD_33]